MKAILYVIASNDLKRGVTEDILAGALLRRDLSLGELVPLVGDLLMLPIGGGSVVQTVMSRTIFYRADGNQVIVLGTRESQPSDLLKQVEL